MNKRIGLLWILVFSFPVQADYNDSCVDSFLSSGQSLEQAYYRIGSCVLTNEDTTAVAQKYDVIENISSDNVKDPEKISSIKVKMEEFFTVVYDRQEQSLDEAEPFPDILLHQKKLNTMIHEASIAIFLEDGTIKEDGRTSITSGVEPDLADESWTSTNYQQGQYAVSYKSIVLGDASTQGACALSLVSRKCKVALQSMADWLRFQESVTGKVQSFYSNPDLFMFQDYTKDRAERWVNFFKVADYPMPWESALNQHFDGYNYIKGEYGLSEPPNSQLTLIRPSVAAGFQNGFDEGPNAELIIEWIGITKWKWSGTEAVDRWGVSLITSYGEYSENNNTRTNKGIGVLFKMPKEGVSFGLVEREFGKNGLVVTFDLLNLWDVRKKQAKKKSSQMLDEIKERIKRRIDE